MTERIAIYPGTFDPITLGHLDVIKRALKLFDRVIVGIADNPAKKPFFPLADRVNMVKESVSLLENVEVKSFSGLLVDFARKNKARVVVRGLRAVSDFEEEFQMATVNRKLDPGLETVFVMTSEKYFYLSSGIVREIVALGGHAEEFVPGPALRRLRQGLPKRKK